MSENPEQRLRDVVWFTDSEREQIRKWNATGRSYPLERCLHELIGEQAVRTPDAVAVQSEGGRLTYRELDARSNQLGRHLRRLGVGPEVLVGVAMERSLEMVVALLGILKAGGAYVPLDPTYPRERLSFMMDDARVPVLLSQKRTRGTAALLFFTMTGAGIVSARSASLTSPEFQLCWFIAEAFRRMEYAPGGKDTFSIMIEPASSVKGTCRAKTDAPVSAALMLIARIAEDTVTVPVLLTRYWIRKGEQSVTVCGVSSSVPSNCGVGRMLSAG